MSNRLQVRGRLARALSVPEAITVANRRGTGETGLTHTVAAFTPNPDRYMLAFGANRKNAGGFSSALSISDSVGLTWNFLGEFLGPDSSAWITSRLWWAATGPSPASMTVTLQTADAGSIAIGLNIVEVKNIKTVFDNIISAPNAAGDPAPVLPFPNGVDNALSFFAGSPANAATVPSGWTSTATFTPGSSFRMACAHKIGAAGATAAWSSANNNSVAVNLQLRQPSFV